MPNTYEVKDFDVSGGELRAWREVLEYVGQFGDYRGKLAREALKGGVSSGRAVGSEGVKVGAVEGGGGEGVGVAGVAVEDHE